jgi:L-threonylcarbamoyladenylate synthase
VQLPPIYRIGDAAGIDAAVDALRRGEIIAYPTDTLYGVGGDARSAAAAKRVYEAKHRAAGKGVPVLLSDASEVHTLAAAWPPAAARLAGRYWPGALTIVVPAIPGLPDLIIADGGVALRVPGLAALRDVIRRAGTPLIGTSANRSGDPPALTAADAARALAGHVALVLDAGRTGGHPSTVVVLTGAEPVVVREGAIPAAEVLSIASRT